VQSRKLDDSCNCLGLGKRQQREKSSMQTVTIWRRFLSNRSGVFVPIFALVTTALLFSIGIRPD